MKRGTADGRTATSRLAENGLHGPLRLAGAGLPPRPLRPTLPDGYRQRQTATAEKECQ